MVKKANSLREIYRDTIFQKAKESKEKIVARRMWSMAVCS